MQLCNINITDINKNKLFTIWDELQILIPINAECIVRGNQDHQLLSIVNSYHTTIDGQIPLWIYQKKYPNIEIKKISGCDVVYDFCEWANKNDLRVFFLGGKDISNKKAVDRINEIYPTLHITGYSSPYEKYPFSKSNSMEINRRLEDFAPHIIFVGFGFGKQEHWLNDNYAFLNKLGVKWGIACGGTFEFLSGEVNRAPKFIQRCGLEGVWRLIMEPKLFRIKRLITSVKILKYL